jgi:hypothetical protein
MSPEAGIPNGTETEGASFDVLGEGGEAARSCT